MEIGTNKLVIPSEEDRENILSKFNSYLENISIENDEIIKIASYVISVYNSFKDYIFPDLLENIQQKAYSTKKIEYLNLILEIIIQLNSQTKLTENVLNELFLYLTNVFRIYYYSFNNDFIKQLKKILKDFKKHKIFNDDLIDELIMELRLTTEPNINGNDD